jgi:diguanylate cyclase (GGDEF)-like protein/PAS domain S-box-containing protein
MRSLGPRSERTTYLLHVGGALLVIWLVATLQGITLYGRLHPSLYLLPTLVAVFLGALLGRFAVLKARLKQKSGQFRAIADLAQEFTYLRNIDGDYEYVSPACERVTGYTQEEFLAHPALLDELVHRDDRGPWCAHQRRVAQGRDSGSVDVRLRAKDGRTVWITSTSVSLFDEGGRRIGVRSTNLDITERKEAEARIERMAYFDPLTDLPNRRVLYDRIRELIDRGRDNPFALLFLDLNRFKNINDSLGHVFGDRLLQLIAVRVQRACAGAATVHRYGGDEFVVLVPAPAPREAVARMARHLLRELEKPLVLEGVDLFVSGSIGISFHPEHGRDPDTLVGNADLAMYASKGDPTTKVSFYHDRFGAEASRVANTEASIQQALRSREFVPFFQPKVDMATGLTVGLEALVRWQHPDGMILPMDFIPVAEETGQIVPLGWQVIDAALSHLSAWRRSGIAVPVAVNVSARQFAEPGFCEQLMGRIDAHGLEATLLDLEITEQVFLGDLTSARDKIQTLRAHGLQISLDDFGTGYSSFNYLGELPITTLKIDRSFIRDVRAGGSNHAILKALAMLCSDLALEAVVEGVETEGQRDALMELGFTTAQGALFHPPMDPGQTRRFLARRPPPPPRPSLSPMA